jgi:hypothetical protein|tara:strand:- start:169 stop:789 length:621 start_codon:yes stop_codon:yes gene_type:complete
MEKYTYTPKKQIYGKKIYLGNYQGEEFFIRPVKWDCGWYWGGVYLEGLRVSTEEKQKEYARESEISDFYSVKDIPSQYLDEEQFQKDMEDNWEERADISERQERNGEEVLLCFGSHTHADSVLLNECKGSYKIALKKFDKLLFKEDQFNELIRILKKFYACKEFGNQNNKKYLKEMEKAEEVLKEFEDFTNKFRELPTEEFWTETD